MSDSESIGLTSGRGRWTEQPRSQAAPALARGSSSALPPEKQNHTVRQQTHHHPVNETNKDFAPLAAADLPAPA